LLLLSQELHDSLPSDPAEADLLKLAEAVADATDDADCAPSSAKKGLCHIGRVFFSVVILNQAIPGCCFFYQPDKKCVFFSHSV